MPEKQRVMLSAELPEITPEIFTTSSAIVGVRGSGKTTDGVVLMENAVRCGVPPVTVDPTGVWYGAKSSADGKSPGLPVYVFGGQHGDVPLESTAGPLIAQFVVEQRVPVVLDLSDLTKGEQRRFVAQFAETLYHLKARHRDPLLVIIDEVQRFCPQGMFKGDVDLAKCIGAIEDIVALGRSRGLGAAIIGPRPATINKNILSTCDNLFAMRTIGTQDRKAIDEWVVEAQGDEDQKRELLRNLATLQQGEGYFWSPAIFGIFRRVKFANRTTFDSSRTPKVGEKRVEPTAFAKIDLANLRGEIAATVERAKADDPKALRAEIAALKKQLDAKGAADPEMVVALKQRVAELEARPPERVEVPVLGEAMVQVLRQDVAATSAVIASLSDILRGVTVALDHAAKPAIPARPVPVVRPQRAEPTSVPPRREVAQRASVPTDGALSKAQRAMLIVLAQNPNGCEKDQLGLLAGYSPNSGHFGNVLGSLRSAGYITRDMPVSITDPGLEALGEYDPLPTGAELRAWWCNRLAKADRAILEALADVYPRGLTKDELGAASGYSANSGHFGNVLGKLRTLKLAVGYGEIKASDALF